MRAEVDRGLCVGSGWCVNVAAPAFEIDDAGKATHVPGTQVGDEQLLEAVDNCPVGAITLTTDAEDTDA